MSKRRLTSGGSWIPIGNQNVLLVESDVLDSWNSIRQSEGLTSDTSIIKFLISLYSHGQRSQHKKVVDVLCASCHNNLYCISCQHKPSVPSPSSSAAAARRATPKHPRQSSLRTETVTSQDIHTDSESVAVAAALEAVASQGIIPHGVISQGVKFPQGAVRETLTSQNISVVASETYPLNETPNTAGKRRTSRVESGAVSMPSVQSSDSYYPSGTDSTTNPTTSATNVVWQTDNVTVKTEVDSEGEADDGECDFEAYPDGQSSQSSSMLAPVRMEPGKEEGGGGDGDGLNSFQEEEGSSLTAGEDGGVAVAGSSNADAGRSHKKQRERAQQHMYLCRDCGKCFKHTNPQQQQEDSTCLCPHCGETCQLVKPQQEEEGKEKMYLCPDCGRGFKRIAHMHEHLKTVHKQGPCRYTCHVCSQGFMSKSHYLGHLNMHAGKKAYVCDGCGKGFAYAWSLRKHICKAVLLETPDAFVCAMCGMSFQRMGLLKEHEWVHKGEVQARYTCAACNRAFKYRSSFKYHKTQNNCLEAKPERKKNVSLKVKANVKQKRKKKNDVEVPLKNE